MGDCNSKKGREDGINLLVKGLTSFPDSTGTIQFLKLRTRHLYSSQILPLVKFIKLCSLALYSTDDYDDKEADIQPLIALGSEVTRLKYSGRMDTLLFESLVQYMPSLTYLKISSPLDSDLPVLIDIVKSHPSLEELHIGVINYHTSSGDATNLRLLIETADKGKLIELTITKIDYEKLPHCQTTNADFPDSELLSVCTTPNVTITFRRTSWV